jgi:hypothetical protein
MTLPQSDEPTPGGAIIQPRGIIGVLCTSNYAPPMIYIRNLLHGTGTMRNFRESPEDELRRISIPRTPVNKALPWPKRKPFAANTGVPSSKVPSPACYNRGRGYRRGYIAFRQESLKTSSACLVCRRPCTQTAPLANWFRVAKCPRDLT